MDFGSLSYLFAGFSFFCVGLIISSKIIKHLRFLNFINLHKIHNIARPYQFLVQIICFSLAIYLIGTAIWMTIDINRDMFWTLAGLGALLILARIFAFSFGDISILGFELELDEARAKKIGTYKSPLLLGGALLILLFGIIPLLTDKLILVGFTESQSTQYQRDIDAATKDNFRDKYLPRNILTKKTDSTRDLPISEDSFFRNLTEQKGLRYILTGKAGVGKTWFLRQLSLRVREIDPEQVLFMYKAEDLSLSDSIDKYVNTKLFDNMAWYTMPLTRQILSNALVLIDGFDEVEFVKRDKVVDELLHFSENYSLATILVTTRPGALSKIKNYATVILDEFSAKQYDLYIQKHRIKSIKKKLLAMLQSGKLDEQFIRLLSHKTLVRPDQIDSDLVEELFLKFLDKYKFKIISGDHYAFMSTFRDMEILEELFLSVLFGGIQDKSQLIRAGRNTLCEQFLLQGIIRNYHLGDNGMEIAKEAISLLTSIAEYEYNNNPSLTKFVFDKKTLHINFQQTVFDQFVLQSELLTEKSLSEADYYVFKDNAFDYYFISRILYKKIKQKPDKKEQYLSKYDFYKGTDILGFLIAQFEPDKQILNSYFSSLNKIIGNEKRINEHLQQNFPEILIYLERGNENIAYLRRLKQHNTVLALPASSQKIIQDSIDNYLDGL